MLLEKKIIMGFVDDFIELDLGDRSICITDDQGGNQQNLTNPERDELIKNMREFLKEYDAIPDPF